MLNYLGDARGSWRIEKAVDAAVSSGICTRDLCGDAGTREFGDAVIACLR